jgi:hypothetical protein
MENTKAVRDLIVKLLKEQEGTKNAVTVEMEHSKFAVVDIALPDKDGNCEVYRIAVVQLCEKNSKMGIFD